MPLSLVQQAHVATIGNTSASVRNLDQFIRIANQEKSHFASDIPERLSSKGDDGAHNRQCRQYRAQYGRACGVSNDNIRLERDYLLANTIGDVFEPFTFIKVRGVSWRNCGYWFPSNDTSKPRDRNRSRFLRRWKGRFRS
jgi:hypothetical protein